MPCSSASVTVQFPKCLILGIYHGRQWELKISLSTSRCVVCKVIFCISFIFACIYFLFNFKIVPGNVEVLQLSHSLGSKLNFSHLVFEIKIEKIIVSLGTHSFWSAVCSQQDIWICVSWRTFPISSWRAELCCSHWLGEAAALGSTELYVQEVARSYGPLLLLNNF